MRRLLWATPMSLVLFAVAVFAMRLERLPHWWLHGRKPCDYDTLDAYMKEAYGDA